jgi:hypothetical protein
MVAWLFLIAAEADILPDLGNERSYGLAAWHHRDCNTADDAEHCS